MKNKEKFAKEIVEIACSGLNFGVDKTTGKVESCDSKDGCSWCMFCDTRPLCEFERKAWSEQQEGMIQIPKKTPIDTVIYVKGDIDDNWVLRHFAGFTSTGNVMTYSCGFSRESSNQLEFCNRIQEWDYAKLYKPLTNFDVYKDDLMVLFKENRPITVRNGKPCFCDYPECECCNFPSCKTDMLKNWLDSPYNGE